MGYAAQAGERQFMMMNGKDGPIYDGMGSLPVFSADGRHSAYAAKSGDKWYLIRDGEPGEPSKDIYTEPVFSPDGKNVAIVVGADGPVLNTQKPGDFSLDFVMGNGNYRAVHLNGEMQKAYYSIVIRGGGKIVFDSDHSFHYLAESGDLVVLVEETLPAAPSP